MSKVQDLLNLVFEKDNIIKSKDSHNRTVELMFIRPPTKAEKIGGSPRQKGFRSIPDKEGWEKVYKQYGEKGAGYYYMKVVE